jgi:hypothetical protein
MVLAAFIIPFMPMPISADRRGLPCVMPMFLPGIQVAVRSPVVGTIQLKSPTSVVPFTFGEFIGLNFTGGGNFFIW